ncbi:hypothetical protein HY643_00795 [Candidatus Woesearchaeota archaeon]|nr:hypothetical protein [Candidatus Woesearchaeota archaeon]
MAKLRRILTLRVWLVLIAVLLSLIAINPSPSAQGVQIKSVEKGSIEIDSGLAVGQIIKTVNDKQINTLQDYYESIKEFERNAKLVVVETDHGIFSYNITDSLGFDVDSNLTVTSSETFSPIGTDWKVTGINKEKISNKEEFNKILDEMLPKKILKIKTNKAEAAYLARGKPKIGIGEASKNNLKKGLELEGGTRVLLKPITNGTAITDRNINDLIKVMSNRLNVYGLSDIKIRDAKDWQGNRYVMIELAGITKEEVEGLIAQQGKFEAKIGNETVFVGGNKDIPFVCRDDGSCSGVRDCGQSSQNEWRCKFEFVIRLSPSAAKKHAEVTNKLDIVSSESGNQILSEKIDFFLDGKKVDSLQISADLKGAEATSIAISGPGSAQTKIGAVDSALQNMDKLQTILITGSLPFDIEIVKLDSISPVLGKSFINNAFVTGIIAFIGVAVVIFIRYRKIKILLPMMLTSGIEIFLTLGFAAVIQWNLDIASIAGIIAAVGTGVDDQIVIVDEVLKGATDTLYTWKERIKRAFFIVFIAYAATVAAMVPLLTAGAGLLRGFAITTIIGVSIGVFLTRPAFASVVERIMKEE